MAINGPTLFDVEAKHDSKPTNIEIEQGWTRSIFSLPNRNLKFLPYSFGRRSDT